MQTQRRRLLQYSLGLPLCLPAFLTAKAYSGISNDQPVSFVEIKNDIAAPIINRGDYLLVDTQVRSFQGNGIYLYPDWGQPGTYEIKSESDGVLGFYYPGQETRLWTLGANENEALFAGQALRTVSFNSQQQGLEALEKYDALHVPSFPLN